MLITNYHSAQEGRFPSWDIEHVQHTTGFREQWNKENNLKFWNTTAWFLKMVRCDVQVATGPLKDRISKIYLHCFCNILHNFLNIMFRWHTHLKIQCFTSQSHASSLPVYNISFFSLDCLISTFYRKLKCWCYLPLNHLQSLLEGFFHWPVPYHPYSKINDFLHKNVLLDFKLIIILKV